MPFRISLQVRSFRAAGLHRLGHRLCGRAPKTGGHLAYHLDDRRGGGWRRSRFHSGLAGHTAALERQNQHALVRPDPLDELGGICLVRMGHSDLYPPAGLVCLLEDRLLALG